ncbi:MAG: tetratricopeptide repeat protein [Desulfovibrio sp.]|uniref:O-linked N-acetylglucosamine transferase, SPINDLY family protein n=1 Tax=Desulfovibrio sp. 7SRBS1 TaxID=3378064 RepID=UPI003B3DD7A0
MDSNATAPDLEHALRLHRAGQWNEAHAAYQAVLEKEPGNAHALHLLGVLMAQAGELDVAADLQQRAASLMPDEIAFIRDLCTTLHRAGRWEDCRTAAQAGLSRFPHDFPLCHALAESLYHLEKFASVPELLQNIPSGHPLAGRTFFLRANARHELADSEGAMDDYASALELVPNMTAARMNLAMLYKERGQVEQAFAMYREAAAADPANATAAATALFFRHYIPGSRPADFLAEAKDWAERFTTSTGPTAPTGPTGAPPARHKPGSILRVGLLSGDFRSHAVGFFLYPALAALQELFGDRLELHCFSNNPFNDDTTERFTALARSFSDIRCLSDEQAAQTIARHKPDLLLDLSGLSPNCRPGVMALRPAPVQALWLGYFNTTGLSAMDWIVADSHVLPAESEPFYTESPLRLPACFFCYPPPKYDILPASELPARSAGHITFGCCNDTAKLNADVLALWAEILRRIPDSRLLLKSEPFGDSAVRRIFAARFQKLGVEPTRLDLRPASSHRDYYATYREIDLAMDPFPYNGGTITCDALWMGVPVVSLSGATFAGRMGRSVLTEAGLSELVTDTPEEYADLCEALSKDLDRLAVLRHNLRQRFTTSPVCDMNVFSKALASALHRMITTPPIF